MTKNNKETFTLEEVDTLDLILLRSEIKKQTPVIDIDFLRAIDSELKTREQKSATLDLAIQKW